MAEHDYKYGKRDMNLCSQTFKKYCYNTHMKSLFSTVLTFVLGFKTKVLIKPMRNRDLVKYNELCCEIKNGVSNIYFCM